MSLYKDYIKERENRECIESEDGFITYKFFGTECYIIDLYVIPSKRKSSIASQMADQVERIAKDRGCKVLTGSVCPSTNNSTQSIQVLISYGFKLIKSEHDLICFAKEI